MTGNSSAWQLPQNTAISVHQCLYTTHNSFTVYHLTTKLAASSEETVTRDHYVYITTSGKFFFHFNFSFKQKFKTKA